MKTPVQLSCKILGENGSAFVVAVERDARVEDLRRIIADSSIVNTSTNHVTLYWVREADLTLPTDDCDRFLQTAIDSGVLVAMQDSVSVKNFGAETVERDGIHIAVQLSSEEEDDDQMRISFHQHTDEDIGLKGLWQYSGLELSTLPTVAELTRLVDRPLPFQLRIRDKSIAEKLFEKDAPELRCGDLTAMIDVFLMNCQAGMNESASKRSWQAVYDHLLLLATQICQANGFHVKVQRKYANEAEDTIGDKLRTDVTIYCNNCVVFGGEEGSASADMKDTVRDWADKMKRWNCLFYGELRYVLGYVTSGDRVMLAAYCPYPFKLAHVRQEEPATAIKAFYNLAFIWGGLSTLSKLTVPTDLSLFKPCESKLGTVELIGDRAVQLTIRRGRCADGRDFKRIVDVYKNLEKLKYTTTYLPHVVSLRQTHFIARKLIVRLDTVGFYRPPENVVEVTAWLQCMLSALQCWHKSGYCHGDVRWENIVRLSGRWVLVNMETSCKSDMLSRENIYTKWCSCRTDLVQLGVLMTDLHDTKFPLTAKLLWVRDKLYAALRSSESVTAEKVLLMMSRMRNSRTKNLRDMVAAVLSTLETPDTSAESVLTLVDELVPPP